MLESVSLSRCEVADYIFQDRRPMQLCEWNTSRAVEYKSQCPDRLYAGSVLCFGHNIFRSFP
jgi:hypothetical protein